MIERSAYIALVNDNLRLQHAIKLYGQSIERKARILTTESITQKRYGIQQKAEEITSLAALLLQNLDEGKTK